MSLARHTQALLGSVGRLARHPFATALTLLVIGLALALPLALNLFVTNAQTATGGFADAVDMSVYFKTDVALAKAQQLAADARRLPPEEFRASAQNKIMERIHATIEDQQILAAANEYLNAESKSRADTIAMVWRYEQVQASGGSEQQAREKAIRENGVSLDELTQNTRDQWLVKIFLQQRIYPMIQVTASDTREYYEQHIKDFTQIAEAKFRIIKIDVRLRGGPEQAATVIKLIYNGLRDHRPFEEVSKLYNDDPNKGIVAGGNFVQKGSYVNEKVEDAVWKLSPGEFTDPPILLSDQNAYYIAILDAKKDGKVVPFEDPVVQERIQKALEDRQFLALRERFMQTLVKQAVLHETPGWQNTVMDMVMQRYYMWNPPKS